MEESLRGIKLTRGEINRFTDAFKDPTFCKLFAEYANELNDPENKRRFVTNLVCFSKNYWVVWNQNALIYAVIVTWSCDINSSFGFPTTTMWFDTRRAGMSVNNTILQPTLFVRICDFFFQIFAGDIYIEFVL